MKGFSGAVISTSDGLLVAGQVSQALKADLIAGFLPEMFSRLNQYSKEIRLGEVQQVSMNAGLVQCRVFSVSKFYLGLLSAADAPLPSATLDLVLKELGKLASK